MNELKTFYEWIDDLQNKSFFDVCKLGFKGGGNINSLITIVAKLTIKNHIEINDLKIRITKLEKELMR